MKNNNFDLIEEQALARQSSLSSETLYKQWDRVCTAYDRGWIGKYEREEMREVIFEHIRKLEALKRSMAV